MLITYIFCFSFRSIIDCVSAYIVVPKLKSCYLEYCYRIKNSSNGRSIILYCTVLYCNFLTGYEVSGTVDALCNTVESSGYSIGDRVIIYPEEEHPMEDGYVITL